MTERATKQEAQDTRLRAHVRRARAADVPALKAVIARAFDDDPFTNWLVKQDARRARHIYDILGAEVEALMTRGEVYTTDDVAGGAVWSAPNSAPPGLRAQIRMLPRFGEAVGWRRMRTILSIFNDLDRKHPKEPHYYLSTLGVEPALQGRGLGTALMAPVLQNCDRDRLPVHLESSKERNVPLYEQNGFRVTEVYQAPAGGPPLWIMQRAPR